MNYNKEAKSLTFRRGSEVSQGNFSPPILNLLMSWSPVNRFCSDSLKAALGKSGFIADVGSAS